MISIRTPAKVNLDLRVVGIRPDGYHLIDSVMVPVDLFDRLEIRVVRSSATAIRCFSSMPGLPVGDENLAVRAARLYLGRVGVHAEVDIRLTKEIPMGAGLGGGSSNAAATLRFLDESLGCQVPRPELMTWALELGADVPMFVLGRPARVRGIGEIVEELDLCPRWPLVIVFPGVPLATRDVYAGYDATLTKGLVPSNNSLFSGVPLLTPESLVNDLEAAAVQILPELRKLKQKLLDNGARKALMTGSGAAMFGVWESRSDAQTAAERIASEGIWARAVRILAEAPADEWPTNNTGGR